MRFVLALALSPFAISAELSPELQRLIQDGATAVYGLNLERYRGSALASLAPPEIPDSRFGAGVTWARYIFVQGPDSHLAIFEGDTSPVDLAAVVRKIKEEPYETDPVILQSGVASVVAASGWAFAVLGPRTAISGTQTAVMAAIELWRNPPPVSELARNVNTVAANFDAWVYLVRPLRHLARNPSETLSKYERDLLESVETIHAGIRIGAANEVQVEAVTRRPEDASTLAGLARWLPGLAQVRGHDTAVIDAIEDLETRADGVTATLRFIVPNHKLSAMLERNSRPR